MPVGSPAVPTTGPVATAMVRCQLMKGTVLIRDPGAMSPLHSFALRAIVEHGDLKETLNAFGVGRRVMQDVLVDLFYEGLVYLDVHQGRIVTAPQIEEALRGGRADEILLRIKPQEIEVTWVQELVSGGVMAHPLVSRYLDRPSTAGEMRSLVAPPSPVTPLETVSARMLARAAFPVLRERAPPADTVLERVERIADRSLVGSRTFYVPLRTVRRAGGQSALTVPDVAGVPQAIVDAWTAALNPQEDPVTLTAATDSAPGEELPSLPDFLSESWNDALAVLRGFVTVPSLGEEDVERADRAITTLQLIGTRIDILARSTESREVVGGVPSRHLERLDRVIDSAREELVFGSAFASVDSVLALAKRVSPALHRGVKVLFLLGLPRSAESWLKLDRNSEIQEKLSKLVPPGARDEIPALSLVPSTSPFHSKFVVADRREAWVTSLNWLNASTSSRQWEASLIGVGPALASDILGLVPPCLPRGHPWRNLIESAGVRVTPDPAREGGRPAYWERVANRVATVWKPHLSRTDGFGIASNAEGLAESVRLADEAGRDIPSARTCAIVADSEHRRLLTRAVSCAKREIILTSDGLNAEGAGSVLTALLRDAGTRGVKITIRWGRGPTVGGETAGSATSAKRAAELSKELGDAADINQSPAGIHGKVLMVDGLFSIVSSFNFLSFGGVPGRERTLSGELGLAVADAEVTQALRRSLFEHQS